MHPEIQQCRPGKCPQCGMTLQLAMPTAGEDDREVKVLMIGGGAEEIMKELAARQLGF